MTNFQIIIAIVAAVIVALWLFQPPRETAKDNAELETIKQRLRQAENDARSARHDADMARQIAQAGKPITYASTGTYPTYPTHKEAKE